MTHRWPTLKVLKEISQERQKQDARWGEQNHPNSATGKGIAARMAKQAANAKDRCEDARLEGTMTWGHILTEEIAEAYEEAALGDEVSLRGELVQCGAVIAAWIECLDRKAKP